MTSNIASTFIGCTLHVACSAVVGSAPIKVFNTSHDLGAASVIECGKMGTAEEKGSDNGFEHQRLIARR
jgi:hypothetical protein